ncbi:SDR family NAD(P)-dependent oxidoreductase [Uruburuella testudinis]|uniref:SDR family NAD(P)-dependent oxidoreductase n=1 Tax=Uruburuella testudinis TaxID=1282863 RepID=A0ABY4DQJ1_9NEIS|nr:SDR family NAD(P)-dependent oxidoreductase [Uruburuella testudinis]UOO80887.1 SDR family NAD(P)-dependent oxidoreductase [Uruburuella testudinis]
MNSKIIISGHSSGLGRALTAYYLAQGRAVLGLSRRPTDLRPSEILQQHLIDLSDSQALIKWLSDGMMRHFMSDADEIVLINNAGTVAPNAVAGQQDADALCQAVSLNITAPLLLSNHAVAAKPAAAMLKIAHISSGAGRTAYPGWSVYGATKAALDHHARCIAAEGHRHVQIASIAPGVVDTPMQAEIRMADAGVFPMVQRFQDLKTAGGLSSAEDTATVLAAMIAQPQFGSQRLADVRD